MSAKNEGGNGKQDNPLEVIRYHLAIAIQIGAPAYNHGDHRGCYEVYACTARLVIHAIQGADEARERLRNALRECSTNPDVTQQAWTMRHAFDAILAEKEPEDEI